MSKIHKEETVINYEPQQVESQGDGHPKKSRWSFGPSGFKNIIPIKLSSFNVEKILVSIVEALKQHEVEFDEHWVKIPRKYFEDFPQPKIKADFDNEEASNKNKNGRPTIKRLFNCITDNKVVDLFKETLSAVKKEVVKLYQNITQYTICFFEGSNQVFAPEEDSYGKLSHFHRMLKEEIDDLPTRRTISYYWKWFVDWKPINGIKENNKEIRKKKKHRLWEKLIKWIIDKLLKVCRNTPLLSI